MSTIDEDSAVQSELAADLVAGADAIARYLGMTRRQVYAHLERGHLPCFRIGATICMRKSTMLGWIGRQEGKVRDGQSQELPGLAASQASEASKTIAHLRRGQGHGKRATPSDAR